MNRLRFIRISLLLCAAIFSAGLRAQEIRATVQVNSDQIQGSNKEVFNTLKTSVEEFLNNSKWTNLTYTETEKIECSILIVVNSISDNLYTCEATIQASRPVFNTAYSSPILNFKDNSFTFTYQEYDQLTYQQSVFQTNLTALLAYYAYLIMGIDADSFQRLGGTPYFQACEDIVNACQTATMETTEQSGWQSSHSSRNRYTLINNLMDEAYKPLRNYFYEYHRLGLDEMQANVDNGRARIASGLSVLKDINKNHSNNYVVGPFLDAKADELVNIFQGGTDKEKEDITDLLMDIDPTRSTTYDRIKSN